MAGNRVANFVQAKMRPGIYTMEQPWEAVGRWTAGMNTRWDSPLPQKIGGYLEQALVDESAAAVDYMGKSRSYLEWQSLDGENWVAFGTACRLYLINNSILYDITPLRRQAYITDGVATVDTESIVTITDEAHGGQDGDHVTISGGDPVGGITLAGEYTILQVIDSDTYTIQTGVAATSTVAAGGGSMTLQYDISCGLESDNFLYGYGVGEYGEETFGTPRSSSDFRGFARIWSLDNWGEDLIASPNGETLYVWNRSTGPQSRAVAIVGAPANVERMLVGPDNRHILAIGTNLASTGIQDKMFVRWCEGDDYNAWLITDTNDAGSKRLDTGSFLITAVKTNRNILIWSNQALYVVSFVGGLDVYDITMVGTSPSVMSPNSVIDVNGTVYAMCDDDFYIWDGTYRVMECDMKNYIFGDGTTVGINRDQKAKVTCRLRSEFNEVWWSYPRGVNTENSESIIYNYELKCWYPSSIVRESGGDLSTAYGYALGLYDGKLWLEENGVNADTGALAAYVESFEQQIADGSFLAEVCELIPNFSRLTGSVDVTMFGRNYPAEARDTGPVRSITSSTTKINPRYKKRQIGFRVESDAIDDDWRMGTWRGKYIPHGR